MVAAQQEKVLRILDLVGQQQADGLQRLLAPIDVVAEEQVIGGRREAAVFEQPQQVCVLAVDVAADDQRCLQLQQYRLLQEYLARLQAQAAHLRLGHLHLFARSAAAHCKDRSVSYMFCIIFYILNLGTWWGASTHTVN